MDIICITVRSLSARHDLREVHNVHTAHQWTDDAALRNTIQSFKLFTTSEEIVSNLIRCYSSNTIIVYSFGISYIQIQYY